MIERQEPLPERRENTQHFLRKCIILHTLLTCIKKRKLSSKLRKQSGRYFDNVTVLETRPLPGRVYYYSALRLALGDFIWVSQIQ